MMQCMYFSLYVDMCLSLSQQSHHINFSFLSCHVKSSPAILWTDTYSQITQYRLYMNALALCTMIMCWLCIATEGGELMPVFQCVSLFNSRITKHKNDYSIRVMCERMSVYTLIHVSLCMYMMMYVIMSALYYTYMYNSQYYNVR